MEEAKVAKVKEWPPPRNVREVRRFLGFTEYYRHFIKGYSSVARPLLELTKKSVEWHWDEEQQSTFEQLRQHICSKPILTHPDHTKTFYVQTNASAYGVGTVLSQEGDATGQTKPWRHPIAFFSAMFTLAE
jgi:hypothetical protein